METIPTILLLLLAWAVAAVSSTPTNITLSNFTLLEKNNGQDKDLLATCSESWCDAKTEAYCQDKLGCKDWKFCVKFSILGLIPLTEYACCETEGCGGPLGFALGCLTQLGVVTECCQIQGEVVTA